MTEIMDNHLGVNDQVVTGCRTPESPGFAEVYSLDDEWHGYINNNDRVLLKVLPWFLHLLFSVSLYCTELQTTRNHDMALLFWHFLLFSLNISHHDVYFSL